MDKYEFNIKAEQIRKLIDQGDYKTAMQIADTIDWRRVRNANLLSSVADIYEQNQEYEEAKDILLLAFERAPVGKRFLFKLSEISVKAGEIQEAQEFYREFCEMSPDDPRQYLLRYMILKAKGAAPNQLINCLEQYTSQEVDEAWLYELAVLYSQADREDDCVRVCDKIMLLFGLGKYVDKAMELKLRYEPLTKQQMDLVENRDKYEENLKKVSEEYNDADNSYEEEGEDREGNEEGEAETLASDADEANAVASDDASDSYAAATKSGASVSDDADVNAALDDAVTDAHPVIERASIVEDAAPKKATTPAKPAVHNYHMIIEAMSREEGFKIAVDEIKFFHDKYGVDYKVAKTNAEKLNEKGFAAFAPKLTDRDLIIEDAGSLRYSVVDEITDYIDKLRTTNSVVLVDVMDEFDRMSEDRPYFIKKFDIVSDVKDDSDGIFEDVDLDGKDSRPGVPIEHVEAANKEARRPAPADSPEAINGAINSDRTPKPIKPVAAAGSPVARPASAAGAATATAAASGASRVAATTAGAATATAAASGASRVAATTAGAASATAATAAGVAGAAASTKERVAGSQGTASDAPARKDAPAAPAKSSAPAASKSATPATAKPAPAAKPAVQELPEEAPQEDRTPVPTGKKAVDDNYEEEAREYHEGNDDQEEVPADYYDEMDIDDFAHYAQEYAKSIDCVMPGKTVLALYERIELMQEDDIPLDKASAEELVEEAADKAEKPSLGKKLGGMFRPKYDKDDKLILHEDNFIS